MTVVSGQPRANSSYSSRLYSFHSFSLSWYSFNFIRSRDSSTKVYITYTRGNEKYFSLSSLKKEKIKTLSMCNSMASSSSSARCVCVCAFSPYPKWRTTFSLHGPSCCCCYFLVRCVPVGTQVEHNHPLPLLDIYFFFFFFFFFPLIPFPASFNIHSLVTCAQLCR